MRTQSFTLLSQYGAITYPDEICFAFNPNYVEIEWAATSQTPTFVLTISKVSGNTSLGSHSINVTMYNGKARIYVSRLFELMFEDPQRSRCSEVLVKVTHNTTTLVSFSTLVVWGNLAMGERFGNLGVFNRDTEHRYYERKLIWFKQFPFTVSLFRYNTNVQFYGRYDGGVYSKDPIYQDTKYCFFDQMAKLAPSLPTLSSIVASAPYTIVYYRQQKRFVAMKGTTFHSQWTGQPTEYYGPSSDYVDSSNDNKPRADVTYLLVTNNGYERYRFLNDELVFCGMFNDLGFEDIPARQIFPKAQREATIKYKVSEDTVAWSVFDRTFDYTFFQSDEKLCLIRLIVNNDTAGHYLRWVDRQGNLQYFLFAKGTSSYKNKINSDAVVNPQPLNGMYFANHKRPRNVEGSVSHKCCAVNLPSDIFDYVVTIITSPIIDLYLGKDESGDDIWQPVNIDSSTVSFVHKKELNDLEFSFSLPTLNAQSL